MKILICAVQFKGGSLQVAISLIKEYVKYPENEYYVVLSREVERQIQGFPFPDNYHFYSLPYPFKVRLMNSYCRHFFLDRIEKEVHPDCVICTSGPIYWKPKSPMVMGYNLGHMIYPESPYFKRLPLWKKIRWQIRFATYRYCYNREPQLIFVQTKDVEDRLSRIVKNKPIVTVSNTCNNAYTSPQVYPDKLPERFDGEFRLLMLSAFYMHKNFEIIPEVICELEKRGKNNVRFVVTLTNKDYIRIFGNSHSEKVFNVGFVPTIEGPSLYNECDAMFLPTLLECFSASYAEAMVMKKPILTSDLGFAHTVCNDAAIYFNPEDASEIADKIIGLMENDKLQHNLINRGTRQLGQFGTAEERAKRILELCKEVANG